MDSLLKTDRESMALIREYVESSTGILINADKEYLVKNRLGPILKEEQCSNIVSLIMKSKKDLSGRLKKKILDAFTTNETLWFRDKHPFEILEQELLPRYAKELAAQKKRSLNFWCAACSTGQEPYSVAMTILNFAKKNPSFNPSLVKITATDISPSALLVAMSGHYDNFSMGRGLDELNKARYFTKEGTIWKIAKEVKSLVTFKTFNLMDNPSSLGSADIVFCRNVAIYFSHEFKKNLFNKIRNIMPQDGALFLGASESFLDLPGLFKAQRMEKGTWYEPIKGAQ